MNPPPTTTADFVMATVSSTFSYYSKPRGRQSSSRVYATLREKFPLGNEEMDICGVLTEI